MTPALILTLCVFYLNPSSPTGETHICTEHEAVIPSGVSCETARRHQQPFVTAYAEALFDAHPAATLDRAELACVLEG